MRIGIFGGSFNPPHKMHESIPEQLIEKGIIDKVIFVPTSNFYPKAGLISDEARFEMLCLMTKDKEEYDSIQNRKLPKDIESAIKKLKDEINCETFYFGSVKRMNEEIIEGRRYGI